MSAAKITPLHDRVVVKPLEEDEQISGGLYIPDTAKCQRNLVENGRQVDLLLPTFDHVDELVECSQDMA